MFCLSDVTLRGGGKTALYYARCIGHAAIVAALLEAHGAPE